LCLQNSILFGQTFKAIKLFLLSVDLGHQSMSIYNLGFQGGDPLQQDLFQAT